MNPAGLLIAQGERPLHLLPRFANRHGLIAGASGTGKTVTLQVLAEGLSAAGVPVFMADVKGDLSGIALSGDERPAIAERRRRMGLAAEPLAGAPTVFWDLFGEAGHPVRITVSDLGPLLLARLLGLTEVQEGVLSLAFRLADDDGLLLLDLKDLRALLAFVAENAKRLAAEYGQVSAASVGAIQRALLALESEGGDRLFGEPALALADIMGTDPEGRGLVGLLVADRLMRRPRVYAAFMIWLLAELYEELPEVGDLERPKLVLVFDEAHLLFADAPPALAAKVEQVVRLIRSKGVGVWFVTQSPLDLPDAILGQLGNRVQHALRAFTPRDQRAVRAAAETFRANPRLDAAAAIGELAVGEALVSLLDEAGRPTPVERALIRPPRSRLGPATEEERRRLIAASPLAGRYERTVDRESAYEMLRASAERRGAGPSPRPLGRSRIPPSTAPLPDPDRATPTPRPRGRHRQSLVERLIGNAAGAVGSQIGRQIARGILGAILRR